VPVPQQSEEQIRWVIQQVADYIEQQRQTYRGRAVALDGHQRLAMQPCFPASALDSARVVVLAEEQVSNSPLYGELMKMGFGAGSPPNSSLMVAITFVDTVVSHEAFTDRLLFHELVHIVQHKKLGLGEFAAKYLSGFLRGGAYEAIPLEMNAYELEGRFAAVPTKAFSVEAEVQELLATVTR
jgi:hypothetical protein